MDDQRGPDAPKSPPAENSVPRIRVMVVDDHRMIRHLMRGVVESYSDLEYVGEAVDGDEAVQTALSLKPDVILMDINMPRRNGIEATRVILQQEPQIAVIGLSIHDDQTLTDRLLEAGAAGYVMKGSTSEEIYAAILNARRG